MAGTVRATSRSSSPAMGYAVATAATATALLLRWLLDPNLGDRIPLATCYGAIAVAVWFGGYGPSLLSAALGYVGAILLCVRQDAPQAFGVPDAVALVLYAASAIAITVLGEGMRAAQRRLEQHLVAAEEEQGRLRREIAERERVERTLEESEGRLAAQLEAMTRLHALSARLATCENLDAGLGDVLDSAMVAVNADFGNVQLYDPADDLLEIVVQRGFSPAFLDHFRHVRGDDGSACAEALAAGTRVVIEDVERDSSFAPHLGIAAEAGFRAVQSTPLQARTGAVLGVLSTHFRAPRRLSDRDRTLLDLHARHAADLLERLRNEFALRDADRRKDEFLATLAHELRNPLAPVCNALELLRRRDSDPGVRQYARNVMDRQLGQLVRLIDDLLDRSRITMGKLQLRKQRIELSAVVESAVEAARPLVEARGHELTVSLPREPIVLEGDPTRLSQVVSNLLNNAAKYTDRGGHVWLRAERENGEAILSVRDSGVGIEAGHLPGIFDMFSQISPALERSQGGLGIGLSLVRGLVELHGGTVEARSAGQGRGSEFVVRLPARPREDALAEAKERTARTASSRSCRILVVDDNQDAAESLAIMLRLMGHSVDTAHDGLEAVQAAAATRPDLLLLDIGLPRMNGYEAARHIRDQPWGARLSLVALTGWGQDVDPRRSLEAGFDQHLTKPVDPATLERVVAGIAAVRPPAA
jgi:signal transduction histidine kinase/CheY-like chemotaxis protein